MPSARRQKTKAKPSARRPAAPARKRPITAKPKTAARPPVKKSSPPAPPPKSAGKSPPRTPASPPAPTPLVRRPDGRVHVLSLSFVRDGDEFLARMETDGGQITELKNRALDQLLTLVASELEDLLE